jgi:hypothetical protein
MDIARINSSESNSLAPLLGQHLWDISPDAAKIAVECLATPIFVLQSDGLLVSGNSSALDLIDNQRIFKATKGVLSLRRSKDTLLLLQAVVRSAADAEPEMVRFQTRAGETSLLLRLQPVPGRALVIVCVAELREPLRLRPSWTRAAFGCNAQSASLAESLANGDTIAGFARQRGTPIGTVRTRLKKLLAQTGLSSQQALVGYLLRGAVLMYANDVGR